MNRVLHLAALLGTLGLGACCGDTEATVQVHVVDGENGAEIAQPTVSVGGTVATCADGTQFLSSPAPTDDGGTVVGPPPGDFGVGPPPSTHFCATWATSVSPGNNTVRISAAGFFGTEVQIDTGSEGGSFSCPNPKDVEITVALYRKPN